MDRAVESCHGIIRSVLYGNPGRRLWRRHPHGRSGAITHHTYGEERVAGLFPTWRRFLRRNYQVFDFAGTQDTAQAISGM
jgi:hypothetical protein